MGSDTVNTDHKGHNAKEPKWYRIRWQFLIPIIVILILFLLVMIPSYLNAPRSHWESRAKSALRAYAEVQLSYSKSNVDSAYGSFDKLREAGYIADGFTRENIIKNY